MLEKTGQCSRAARVAHAMFWPLCFVTPIALLVAVSIWNGVYPFGPESFLTEDLKFQYIDFFTWYREVLLGQRDIFYSFSQALGSNTWGLFSYYLASPFNLLIVLFDEQHLVAFVYLITALKLGCIQVACAWFLSRRFAISKTWAFTLSLCFTWCSWVTTQMRNPMWLDALILLPLMAYSAHLLIRKGSVLPLAVLTTIDVIVCWYMAYITIVFTCFYVLFELACHLLDENATVTGAWVVKRALRFTGVLMLGLLLSAWTFVPTVLAMMGGIAAKEPGIYFICTPTSLIKGFLPGGYTLDLTPQFFTGTVVTLLAFAFLLCRRISGRLRLIALAFLAFLVASSIFSPLEYFWCGFRVPNGFWSRTAFLASFLAIWMAARYLESRTGRPLRRLSPAWTSAAAALVLVFTLGELAFNAHVSWSQLYTGYPQKTHDAYLAESRKQLEELRALDSSEFYRIGKTYTRVGAAALNEGLSLGFNQLSSYSSANAPRAIELLNSLGYSSEGEFSTRYTQPLLATDALMGVKYAAAGGTFSGYQPLGITPASSGETWSLNPYALSLGYAVSNQIANSPFPAGDNPFERQNALFSTLLGEDVKLYRPINVQLLESSDGTRTWSVEVGAGCIGYAWVETGDAGNLGVLSLTIDGANPVPEASRWDHTIRQIAPMTDGTTTHTVMLAMIDQAAAMPEGTDCVFYALDMDAFTAVINRLAAQQAKVDTMRDGFISMSYEGPEDQTSTLLLTIPFDKGWSVQVNGKDAELCPAFDGGLSTLEVPAGASTITMSYRSPGFVTGCAISGVTLATLIGFLATRKMRSKKREVRPK